MPPFDSTLYALPVLDLARALIGSTFTVEGVGGVIVETEAYHAGDPAAHSFGGPRPRAATMWGPAGHVYVYRSYGLHWCVNVVGGAETAAAVLIRALEPGQGLAEMAARRGMAEPRALCSGPGKLAAALGITGAHDGMALDRAPFALTGRDAVPAIVAGPRIGISRAADCPWRFGLAGSRFLSRPFPRAALPEEAG